MNAPVKFHAPAAVHAAPALTITLGLIALIFLWLLANNKAALYFGYATGSKT